LTRIQCFFLDGVPVLAPEVFDNTKTLAFITALALRDLPADCHRGVCGHFGAAIRLSTRKASFRSADSSRSVRHSETQRPTGSLSGRIEGEAVVVIFEFRLLGTKWEANK
jgi:hypothetical protein